jgi:hypothetical protein
MCALSAARQADSEQGWSSIQAVRWRGAGTQGAGRHGTAGVRTPELEPTPPALYSLGLRSCLQLPPSPWRVYPPWRVSSPAHLGPHNSDASTASVAGAGAPPALRAALLPDAASAPLAAALCELAALQPRHVMAAGGGALVFPVDLRRYCGYAPGGGPSAPAQGSGGGGGAVRCCFFSGRQCARCSGLDAADAGKPLAARVDACRVSLVRYLPVLTSAVAKQGLGAAAARELAEGARLYALQRAVWYEPELSQRGGDGGSGSGREAAGLEAAATAAAAAAAVSVDALLAPLREVEALRQIQQEQGRGAWSPAWAPEAFEEMAWDALEGAVRERPAAAGADCASGSGGGRASLDGGGAPAAARPEDFEFEGEALEALAAGAEALLADAFAAAQGLALRAGRQEVAPADLRAALRGAGLSHLLPAGTPGAREEEEGAAEAMLPGLL